MSAELAFRRGTPADVPDVLSLMKRSLGEGQIPRTREFWAWKHEANPFGSSPFTIAESADGIVGVRVFMRWRFVTADRSFEAVRAVDTATDPLWQGKGIFRRLTLALVDDLTAAGTGFVFNTPNDKSRPGYLKMGWSSVGKLDLWIRPRTRRVALALLRRGKAPPPLDWEDPPEPAGLGAPRAGPVPTPHVDALHTPKTEAFLRWRYAECPAARYGTYETDGAVVVTRKRSRFGLRELALSELLFDSSPRGALAARSAIARAVGETQPDYVLAASDGRAWSSALLATCGFVPAPRTGPLLTARPLNVEGIDVTNRRSWAPSVGDMELF